jgi:hypothetical protein
VSEQQLALAPVEPAVELELVDGTIADELAVIAAPAPASPRIESRNLVGEAERIAARAASASTRRQYASIFRAFGDVVDALRAGGGPQIDVTEPGGHLVDRDAGLEAVGGPVGAQRVRVCEPLWTRTRSPPTAATSPRPAAAAGVRRHRPPRACTSR